MEAHAASETYRARQKWALEKYQAGERFEFPYVSKSHRGKNGRPLALRWIATICSKCHEHVVDTHADKIIEHEHCVDFHIIGRCECGHFSAFRFRWYPAQERFLVRSSRGWIEIDLCARARLERRALRVFSRVQYQIVWRLVYVWEVLRAIVRQM